ncbi:type II toxin-antitoxin system RelE/ParE family toxin [Erwinia sp. CGal63]|uniref:type II toxin-antitoxin system RelE/ParE family toxin n=1 Tax=Erwinia sp. CGal63 TaxID=2919889 RepID=UPI00300BA851
MAIFVLKPFDKNLKGTDINDDKIRQAAREVTAGCYEANLGGHVYKKRIPLAAGKSGGARAVIVFKLEQHLFFVNGYAKSSAKKSGKEISDSELDAYRRVAADLLAMPPETVARAIAAGKMREVKSDG